MPDAANRETALIIGRSLIGAEAIAQELRQRLLKRLAGSGTMSQGRLMELARQTLAEFEPTLAASLYDSTVASWIAGIATVAGRLSENVIDQLAFAGSGIGQPPHFDAPEILWGASEPVIRFPRIEIAAQRLADRRVMTRQDFDKLASSAKGYAFTIARENSTATLEKVQETLSGLIAKGPTLREFREQMKDGIWESQIGPGHVENVYRTNVQSAYSDGQENLASNPIIQEVFPYAEYQPINDARTQLEHLELGRLGIDGTGVYRADDPFWEIWTPPCRWNCRCSKTFLSIEAAARKGVAEAKRWLATGIRPELQSRLPFIPFSPPPGWSTRPRVAI